MRTSLYQKSDRAESLMQECSLEHSGEETEDDTGLLKITHAMAMLINNGTHFKLNNTYNFNVN